MTKNPPILLLATERSGTNLLRAILMSNSQISSPPPCGMIEGICNIHYRYFKNTNSNNVDDLVKDVITLTKSHLQPWPVKINANLLTSKLRKRSFWEIFRVLNEIYAEYEGKPVWFSKEPGLFRYIYQLSVSFPNTKFIYMVRDPRDVVASMLNGGLHEPYAYGAAKRWRDEQQFCLNAMVDPLLKDRIFMVKYESIIKDSVNTVKKLMRFLEIEFEYEQLEYHRNKTIIEYSKRSNYWTNLKNPIDKNNTANYLTALSKGQIKLIETIAWSEMKYLGYPTIIDAPGSVSLIQHGYYSTMSNIKRAIHGLRRDNEYRRHIPRIQALRKIVDRIYE